MVCLLSAQRSKQKTLIYAFDTFYFEDKAKTACVGFEHWEDEFAALELVEVKGDIQAYESGSFYKRELPCILSLLEQINLKTSDILVVDGFVHLNDEGKHGLGGYLFES